MSLRTDRPTRKLEPLGFDLADVARLLRRKSDLHFQSIGISALGLRILSSLSKADGVDTATLVGRLEIKLGALCRAIDRLEERRLVEWLVGETQPPGRTLHLTGEGAQAIARMKLVDASIISEALEGLSDSERMWLRDLLKVIRCNLASDLPDLELQIPDLSVPIPC